MRKSRILRAILVIACFVALILAFPALIYVPLGVLRHEAFFRGKPTDYWVQALRQEPYMGQAPPTGDVGKTLREGGAAAVPVLSAITENPDDTLRAQALALPVLNDLLHDQSQDERLRILAIRVLWHARQPAGPLVAALCQILS